MNSECTCTYMNSECTCTYMNSECTYIISKCTGI